MTNHPAAHDLGRIDVVTLDERPALSRDVPDDLAAVQAAWPDFEGAFDSLRGRSMMGLVYDGVYRLSTVRLDRDVDNPLALDETVIPGGDYLRLRPSTSRSARPSTCSSPVPTTTPADRTSSTTAVRARWTAWCRSARPADADAATSGPHLTR